MRSATPRTSHCARGWRTPTAAPKQNRTTSVTAPKATAVRTRAHRCTHGRNGAARINTSTFAARSAATPTPNENSITLVSDTAPNDASRYGPAATPAICWPMRGMPKKLKNISGSSRLGRLKAGWRQRRRNSLRVWRVSMPSTGAVSRNALPPRRAVLHQREERFLQAGARDLEVAHVHPALEQRAEDQLGVVRQQADATVAGLDLGDRQP